MEIEQKVEAERKRILEILNDTDTYSILLDPMVESYLDIYRIYEKVYDEWQSAGFPFLYEYENKSGAINKVKHPLLAQVDTWSDKKMKALERLGMTNKALSKKVITGGTTINTNTGTAESDAVGNAVLGFKAKWKA